ncbi:MAG: hypothetical protein LBJ31_00110 [Treponema sp.]|jgi:hypothetical protein|nr:hypothetical protein [Treponema sp.]
MAKHKGEAGTVSIFIFYSLGCLAVICVFRYFFPGTAEPLEYYSLQWRASMGLTDFITLFPAIAFSALVIPFGLKEHPGEGYAGTTYVGDRGFSPLFLQYITWPVISAAFATAVYAVLFLLVLPMTLDARAAMENRAELYQQAKARAERMASEKNWAEARRFIEICDNIWPHSAEMDRFKNEITASLANYQNASGPPVTNAAPENSSVWVGLPGDPVNSVDALGLAREALDQERYYDAHWLAVLAERLARPGAAEIPQARGLASQAWEKIASLSPNAQEQERYRLYRLKRDGYEAMLAEDWISAYYTFQDLKNSIDAASAPPDPDVDKYFEASKQGVSSLAFFVDELDLVLGTIQRGPVFSFPLDEGRLALRFGFMAALREHSYAWNTEIIAADSFGAFRYKVSAPYTKIIPVSETAFASQPGEDKTGDEAPAEKTALLLRSLDRGDRERRFDPLWSGADEAEFRDPILGGTQITLDIGYENFLLLARLARGSEALHLNELFTAEDQFEKYGYLSEVFRAELLRRLGECAFFLPMTVLILLLGWRFRSRRKPRYAYIPMLGVLPLVFYGAALFFRILVNNFSIWLSLSMSLNSALICLIGAAAGSFIAALALLAAQHG